MVVELLEYARVDLAMPMIVAIEKEITVAVAQILGQNMNTKLAKPFMRYDAQGAFPLWLNGMTKVPPDFAGNEVDSEPYAIKSELQIGKKTEGYDGRLEQQLYTWIPYTLAMGRSRPRLTSDEFPDAPETMLQASIRVGQHLMPGDVIAAEFIWVLEFFISNPEQDGGI